MEAAAHAWRHGLEFDASQLKGFPSVFTKLIETGAPNLYSDEDFVLFLNAPLPYPDMYPGDPGKAGISFAHMLACPRAHIYNAAALDPGDEDLIARMCHRVSTLMNSMDFRSRVLETLTKKMGDAAESPRFKIDSHIFLENTHGGHMKYYVHLHPHHSQGHLHIHCVQSNLRTSTEHDWKNTEISSLC